VADVLVDGSSVGAVTSYTFTDVTADHTVSATFAINGEPAYTPTGSNVTVSLPGGTTVTFGAVTASGNTSVNWSADNLAGPTPPNFYVRGQFMDILTTATYTGPVRVCMHYDESGVSNENNLRLFHWNGTLWEDVTTPPVDTVNNIICGQVNALSPFFVGELMAPGPTVVPSTGLWSVPTVKPTPASTITVTSPYGGENWMVGTTQTITWTSDGANDLIKIYLSRDGGNTWKTIVYSTLNDGKLAWRVTGPATAETRIRVVSIKNKDVLDESDANFTIVLPTITVAPDSPNGGENWKIGTLQTITWTSDGVTGPVRIDLSRDGGGTWRNIIAYTSNDGRQAWKVTAPATTEARIRVVSIMNSAVFDVSDANFTISPR